MFQIFLLLFILLYLLSFAILNKFKRRGREDYFSTDEDEVTVFRISTWLCTFSLAISIGAVLLLPISIVSNEVLILYPNSYYVQWLNISLIQGIILKFSIYFHSCLFNLRAMELYILIFVPFVVCFTSICLSFY